jgi:hypothetical protein
MVIGRASDDFKRLQRFVGSVGAIGFDGHGVFLEDADIGQSAGTEARYSAPVTFSTQVMGEPFRLS